MYISIWMVFLFPFAAHTAKCFLVLSHPLGAAINTFLDISSIFLHIFIQTGSLNKIRISICSLSIQRCCQIQFFFCKVFFNIIILCVSEWYFTSS